MIRKIPLLPLLLLACLPVCASAQRATVPHWRSCTVGLDWATMTRVTYRRCTEYTMPKRAGQHVTGHWQDTRYVSPHVRLVVRYPTFAAPQTPPAPATATPFGGTLFGIVHVTGYCLTGTMASGQGVYYGAVANNVLPFGTVVTIPSLGYTGRVEDRGDAGMGSSGIDVWEPSCAATYGITGYRAVYIK